MAPARQRRHDASRIQNRFVGALAAIDCVAVIAASAIALQYDGHHSAATAAEAILLLLVSVVTLNAVSGLYHSRILDAPSLQLRRVARVSIVFGILALTVGTGRMHVSDTTIALGAVLTFLFVASARSLYGGWLRSCRARGLYARPTVIIGTNDEAIQIAGHLSSHPELGYEVKGYIGPVSGTIPTLGDVSDAVQLAASVGATDAVVVPTALTFGEQQQLIKRLLGHRVHVLLSAGLCGIDARRVRPVPTAHEPLLYIKRNPRPLRDLAKRTIDLVLGCIFLIVAVPIFLITAIAIKFEDRGPVLFKQQRIGRRGKPFIVYKFRSMVPDAEQRLGEVLDLNERDGGPLFKAEHDPRVTRVGRIMRATSIDELAQLINVIRGDMSLVGPRPALPAEVEQFDDELRTARNSVRPGMTGLWQVEARDSPSFDSYRYLDLFYSENCTTSLDLAILAGTAKTLVTRTWRLLARGSGSEEQPHVDTPHLQLHVSDLGD